MTKDDIIYNIIHVVAANSRFTAQRIYQMYQPLDGLDPNLDRFIPPSKKAMLATKLEREMDCIQSTKLTNQLYTSILTLGQLIKQISLWCETKY